MIGGSVFLRNDKLDLVGEIFLAAELPDDAADDTADDRGNEPGDGYRRVWFRHRRRRPDVPVWLVSVFDPQKCY